MGPTHPARIRIGIDGLGYMGLATGLAFAQHGSEVVGYDIRKDTLDALASGKSPYFERGLSKLLRSNLSTRRFRVVESVDALVRQTDVIFLCLPTPQGPDGHIDLRALEAGIDVLAPVLRKVPGYRVVVIKSTVAPGTTQQRLEPRLRRLSGRSPTRLGVAVNPEFLAEGSMVEDAVHPVRVVVGATTRHACRVLEQVYRGFDCPVFELTPSGAELVKYSANTFLALKVSFANEISRMAEILGTDVDDIMAAVGKDPRIGERFLKAGPGFGGSCFEKDVSALDAVARDFKLAFRTGRAALDVNEDQVDHVLALVKQAAGSIRGRSVALLGLAFKAGTDDVRGSRALLIAEQLLEWGARVRVHDPVALETFRAEWQRLHGSRSPNLKFARRVEDALRGADLAILQADWPEYARWPNRWTRTMKKPVVVDLRRALVRARRSIPQLEVRALGTSTALGKNRLSAVSSRRGRGRGER